MKPTFLSATPILSKDMNLFWDVKHITAHIAEISKNYSKKYEDFTFKIIVIEDEGEYMVFADKPFETEEAKEWLLNGYLKEYQEPTLHTPDNDYPVLVSMPESLYRHQFLKNLSQIGCKPFVKESVFDVWSDYGEMRKSGKEPKIVFVSEQSGCHDIIQRLKQWYPEIKIVGVVFNLHDTLPVYRFMKNGADDVIKVENNEASLQKVMNGLYPEIFINI